MFGLTIKLSKENEKLERNILASKNHVNHLESDNNRLSNELDEFRRQSLKSSKFETCDSLRNEIEILHETLSKFAKGKENLGLTLSNQRASHNKTRICYRPNKSFISICHAKHKTKHSIYK